MYKRNILRSFLLTLCYLVITPSMAAQSESPVACTEGVEPLNIVYGDHTTECNIEVGMPSDLDRFTFDANADDTIRIKLLSLTNGLDPRIEIRDPDGVVIKDTFCSGNDVFGNGIWCAIAFDMNLSLTGQHQISISDSGANETGNYQFQLEIIPPDIAPPGIMYGSTESDIIDIGVDSDFFVINANENSDIRITVSSQTNGLDPRIEVWDPDGTAIINTSCSGNDVFGNGIKCIFTFDLSISLTGTYLFATSDVGTNEGGSYDISLECLFGNCPLPPTRPECDIQLSQAAYIDGETVTADVFRFANLTAAPMRLETKVWLAVPGAPPKSIVNLGADGSFILPAGADINLGPLAFLPVTAALPLGSYEFSCRMLEPTTGRLLVEDRNFFDIQ